MVSPEVLSQLEGTKGRATRWNHQCLRASDGVVDQGTLSSDAGLQSSRTCSEGQPLARLVWELPESRRSRSHNVLRLSRGPKADLMISSLPISCLPIIEQSRRVRKFLSFLLQNSLCIMWAFSSKSTSRILGIWMSELFRPMPRLPSGYVLMKRSSSAWIGNQEQSHPSCERMCEVATTALKDLIERTVMRSRQHNREYG